MFESAPGPVPSVSIPKSAQKTSDAARTPSQSQALKTPQHNGTGRSLRASSRRPTDANTSVKRRKLNTNGDPLSIAPQTAKKDIYAIPREEPSIKLQESGQDRNASIQPGIKRSARKSKMDIRPEAFNGATTTAEQAQSSQANASSAASSVIELAQKAFEAIAKMTSPDKPHPRPLRQDKQAESERQTGPLESAGLNSATAHRSHVGATQEQTTTLESQEPTQDTVGDIDDVAEEVTDKEAAAALQRHRPSSRYDRSSARSSSAKSVERPMRRVQKQGRAISPVQQRQSERAERKAQAKSKKRTGKHPGSNQRISIPVQRLTGGFQFDDDYDDADILNAPIPCVKRSGVNVIDVLHEMCNEVVNSTLDTLREARENTRDANTKREYLTKRKAVEAFGRELNLRLLEHVRTLHIVNMSLLMLQRPLISTMYIR